MQLFSTKKALDYFKEIPVDGTIDGSFNQWGLMFQKFKRRNLLLLMHLPTRYLVLFYGVTKQKNQTMKDYLIDLMREFYESKGIKNEVIGKLLAKEQVTFSTTQNRSLAGSLSIRYQDISVFLEELDEFSILQSKVMDDINWIEGTLYERKVEGSFFIELEKEYPKPYRTPHAIELKTELLLENYVVERHFVVNSEMSLYDLHRLLQIGYQYTDSYVHSFYTLNQDGEVVDEISNLYEFEDTWYVLHQGIEDEMTIGEMLEESDRFLYVYNFYSNWRVLITPIKNIQNINKRLPICSQSNSEAPHESLGSETDYEIFIELLEEFVPPLMRQYVEPQSSFDLSSINSLIQKELYR